MAEEEEVETFTKIYIYAAFLLTVVILTPLLRRVPRDSGKFNIISQIIFLILSAITLLTVPEFIQNEIFSPAGIVVLGVLMPIYESIHAVCTPGGKDDSQWLTFWLAYATFSYTTEFMDVIAEHWPRVGEHWHEFQFFVTLWLVLPFTNGAGLFYEKLVVPYCVPRVKKMKVLLEGWGGVITTVVNASNLGFVWFVFLTLPEEARRFVTVAVGTVYPVLASTVALTTKDDGFDDTYWLTYWAVYAVLFMCMDYLENFIGFIPGFYSLCLAVTVYLYLPLFGGAEVVFRKVLVPLSGQHEQLLLHDAYLMRLEVEKKIPPGVHEVFLPKLVDIFSNKKND